MRTAPRSALGDLVRQMPTRNPAPTSIPPQSPFPSIPPPPSIPQAIEYMRPLLDPAKPLKERARAFWAGIVAARDLATPKIIHDQFLELALDTGLFAELGQHPPHAAEETVEHLIRWGLLTSDPFGKV
jgi:hypothetical protein